MKSHQGLIIGSWNSRIQYEYATIQETNKGTRLKMRVIKG